jgi:hypothetical protein
MNAVALRRRADADGLPPLLAALWWDAQGDWERAHELAQSVTTAEAAWVHAYLHRREGDLGNAEYWYRRAGRQRPDGSLEEEWAEIVAGLAQ